MPDIYVPMLTRPESIQLKAEVSGSAVVAGWTLTGVFEASPLRLSVKLQQDAGTIAIDEPHVTKALTLLTEEPEDAEVPCICSERANIWATTYVRRPGQTRRKRCPAGYAERRHNLRHRGQDGDAATGERERLRHNRKRGAQRQRSRMYPGWKPSGAGGDPPSLHRWGELDSNKPGKVVVAGKVAEQVYIKAETGAAQLIAWHLEGLTLTEQKITADLVKAPQNVTAADWSKYYANRGQWRYDLSWARTRSPAERYGRKYTTSYEIYRNGTLLATVSDTKYTDTEYVVNAMCTGWSCCGLRRGIYTQGQRNGAGPVTVMRPGRDAIGVNNTTGGAETGRISGQAAQRRLYIAAEEKAPPTNAS
ncbi:MAG: hypothetical protein V8T45_02740 [Oscillospiraceae bacterium]